MWAVVSASVIGTSHEAVRLPCQDAYSVVRAKLGDEDVLIVAIADGAGSASHSQIGSKEAVEHLTKLAASEISSIESIDHETIRKWYSNVLLHLKEVAVLESVEANDLACTLLLGVACKSGAVFAQVGDGAWVIEVDNVISAATWPEKGEFANVTAFLTTEGSLNRIQFKRYQGSVRAIAGFTDGIENMVLNSAEHTSYAPFFEKMFSPLRACDDDTLLVAPLRAMLASETVNARTDDDKTLVLGVLKEPMAEASQNGTPD
jgi:hypothetical protein